MSNGGKFIYKKPVWNLREKKAEFFYQLEHGDEEINFTETLVFPSGQPISNIPQNLLNNVLANLSLALGISYYKLYCPRQIILEGMELSEEQGGFWNTLYTKGLGEFFYKNKIDFRGLISFPFNNESTGLPRSFVRSGLARNDKNRINRALVGIGGGKDSIAAAELLKSLGKSFSGFAVDNHSVKEQIAKMLGVDLIIVKREIDPKLFELNRKHGIYNGHIPISSIYAFIGLFTALLYDYRYIIVANEQSANYGNMTYLGETINHQWSKSFEFEKLFSEYVKKYITEDAEYFSLLRPFGEIAITKIFVRYPRYFPVFSSCNKNFKISAKTKRKWCLECAKCAFAYAILSVFLPKQQLVNIFGENLFDKIELVPIYKKLLGISEIKPFDCVGTPDEVRIAFYLAMQRREYDNDIIMKLFCKEVFQKIKNIDAIGKEVFKLSDEHGIPKEFQEVLKI